MVWFVGREDSAGGTLRSKVEVEDLFENAGLEFPHMAFGINRVDLLVDPALSSGRCTTTLPVRAAGVPPM